ncbi:hypothetical protein ESA_pESA3p05477 (plasmid) [Cronobacter sakazakii ATCC BAA-894]|uniref:Uncharacterized protein n=1 Tax=Cronobacter sakazakii (strain ATCC BAA-894) TaxID=290339 RepID=A7MRP1_CROS8|nr:hypothetical protein ESA_pESA3p05477 [Cronobacter sakazakii ATCC BAA-894]
MAFGRTRAVAQNSATGVYRQQRKTIAHNKRGAGFLCQRINCFIPIDQDTGACHLAKLRVKQVFKPGGVAALVAMQALFERSEPFQ